VRSFFFLRHISYRLLLSGCFAPRFFRTQAGLRLTFTTFLGHPLLSPDPDPIPRALPFLGFFPLPSFFFYNSKCSPCVRMLFLLLSWRWALGRDGPHPFRRPPHSSSRPSRRRPPPPRPRCSFSRLPLRSVGPESGASLVVLSLSSLFLRG